MPKFYEKEEPQKNEQDKKNQLEKSHLFLDNRTGPEQPMFPVLQASTHPFLSAVHILLKIIIVAVYLIFPLFTKSFLSKEIVIVLAAIDFWIVKNLVGRLLVGLRWWVDFEESGQEMWKFECKVDESQVNPANDKIFWWTLALFTLIWLVLTIVNIFRLDITEVLICLFCGLMIGFNLYSYYQCSKAQSENVRKLAFQYGQGAMKKFMAGSIVANYF